MASRSTRQASRQSSTPSHPPEDGPSQKRHKADGFSMEEEGEAENRTDAPSGIGNSAEAARPPATKFSDEVLFGRDEVVTLYVDLDPLPVRIPRILELTHEEVKELENALELGGQPRGESWREDWAGNLALLDKEVCNPKAKEKRKQGFRQTLLDWAANNPECTRLVWNLMRYVIHFPGVPDSARKALAAVDPLSLKSLERAIRRTTFDPLILREDGWITAKSSEEVGATGGPSLIGELIRWQHSDAVVIAYDHDEEIGDMWKALWIDHDDFLSFDLEAEEVLEARRKWERRQLRQNHTAEGPAASRKSARYVVSSDFSVKGIEHGVVLAQSLSKGARPGVFWPARVMHVSESPRYAAKRSSSKTKVDVVFFAPYWNADDSQSRGRRVESLSESGPSAFSSGSLFQFESIDASEEMIREYPHEESSEIDVDKLRTTFRFTGLPRAAFSRFLDSQRLALSLKSYAKRNLTYEVTETDKATAGLFDSHPLSVRSAAFPAVVLNLPFEYILSQLPHPDGEFQSSSDGHGEVEPILKLETIVDAMRPPQVFGAALPPSPKTNSVRTDSQTPSTPGSWLASTNAGTEGEKPDVGIEHIFADLGHLNDQLSLSNSLSQVTSLIICLKRLFLFALSEKKRCEESGIDSPNTHAIIKSWVSLKRQGVDALSTLHPKNLAAVAEWQRAAERLYKYITSHIQGFGEGVTMVLTDARCNGHVTSTSSFERSVRLPAAIKAVRLASASQFGRLNLVSEVPRKYVDFVEKSLLQRVHTAQYLKRMKSRCAAATESDVIKLTDDSDGFGGEDTMGSNGTWMAAVCGVAAAIAGAEKIVFGESVNVFCATRPPGHHAGRDLHPMKAVSNGFCVLNSVAAAAIFATMPLSEGGLGLSKVCVLDFDAHHGNGTQDILCSTYDSRFLYISLHAGGPEVNGVTREEGDDPKHELHELATKSGGIFPGRCGDTSPHKGVLNIPLGARVNAHDVGQALIEVVSPRVESFSPDLLLVSAGFDAHKHDPMGLGTLTSEAFGHITEVACQLAYKTCSGRLLSILEGGYGVPCCRAQRDDLFLPNPNVSKNVNDANHQNGGTQSLANDESNGITGGTESFVSSTGGTESFVSSKSGGPPVAARPQPTQLLDLGNDLPDNMDDQVPYGLQKRLEKCHAEGFIQCVQKHVEALAKCNTRK